jgi:hypothetical protein
MQRAKRYPVLPPKQRSPRPRRPRALLRRRSPVRFTSCNIFRSRDRSSGNPENHTVGTLELTSAKGFEVPIDHVTLVGSLLKEAPVRIELTNSRFAVCRLTTWPRRRTQSYRVLSPQSNLATKMPSANPAPRIRTRTMTAIAMSPSTLRRLGGASPVAAR